MVRPFRFAVQVHERSDPQAIAESARMCEDFGYQEFYSSDHIGKSDPFIPLVVAAAATRSLRVGPLVINNELHNPVLLARTAASVDQMSEGRLVLGMGTGYAEEEHAGADIELRSPGPRVTRFSESLHAIRSLLDTGACHVDGQHVRIAIDDLGLPTRQSSVPFLIGGHGKRVVGVAARHAQIFQFTGLGRGEGGMPTASGFAIEDIDQRARWLTEAAGSRDSEIERSILVQKTDLSGSSAQLQSGAAEEFEVPQEVVGATPFILLGSVNEVAEKLQSLRDRIGVSHVVIRDARGFAPVVAKLAGT